jgi:hypothetical protein
MGRDALMKIRTEFRRVQFLVVPVLAALLFLSCSDSDSPPAVEDPTYDRTTTDNLLVMLAASYRDKNLDDYDECLDKDFLFLFTPEVADSLGLAPDAAWWGKTADLNSTQTMFGSPVVTDIVFSYEVVGDWEPVSEVRADTTYSGLFLRLEPFIEVSTVVDSEDPIRKLRVDDSWLDVVVVPDRHTDGLWTILSIREVRKHQRIQGSIVSQSAATEATSWSDIKAMFY